MVGFDLTTRNSEDGDDTTRPRHQGNQGKLIHMLGDPQLTDKVVHSYFLTIHTYVKRWSSQRSIKEEEQQ
jgi:hypothetical protein